MRTITNAEYEFMVQVGACHGLNLQSIGLSRDSLVEPLNDGGMGSLRFQSSIDGSRCPSFGEAIVQGEFDDVDDVSVSFTINVDTDGMLFELDLWRVDFEPLQMLPRKCDEIRILPKTS